MTSLAAHLTSLLKGELPSQRQAHPHPAPVTVLSAPEGNEVSQMDTQKALERELGQLENESHAAEEQIWIAAMRYLLDLKIKHLKAHSAPKAKEYDWLLKKLSRLNDSREAALEEMLELDWAPYDGKTVDD